MKNQLKKTVCTFLLIAGGCSGFLDEELQGTYSSATFYRTEAHARLALTGIYNIASFVSTDNRLWVFGDVASDDAIKGGAAGDQIDIQFIDEFNYNRSNGVLDRIWKRYYEGITRANYLILYGPRIDMDPDLRARLLGEARFLRAYFYFNLVNIFGDIPLKVNPPLSDAETNKPKSPAADIYGQIEEDLTAAIPVLVPASSAVNAGTASTGAALGLLAKAHLFQQEWADALAAIQDLEALGKYALQPVYRNNFLDSTQNNTESIFEIQHISRQVPKLGSHLNQYFSPAKDNGYFFNVPTQSFIDEFEKTSANVPDPRLDYTVGRTGSKWVNKESFDPSWSPTGYLQKKHVQPTREEPIIGDAGLNYVYLRYADILLMKAEALNELNRSAEALVPLNAVRKRARESYLYDQTLPGYGTIPAGLLPEVTITSQAGLRDAIRHERRVELGFEFHRYFDVIRYGKDYADKTLGSLGFSYADNNGRFLIPQSELDTNPAIDEN